MELVRLKMKKRGMDVDTDTDVDSMTDAEEAKKKKPEMRRIDQLVSKMVFRRKDNGAYRPLTGWRPFGTPDLASRHP